MPGRYTLEALKEEICARLGEGESLRRICRDDHMPPWTTVGRWVDTDSEFSLRFTRAQEARFDAIAEEALAIADTLEIGETETEDGEKRKIQRGDMLGHRRLRIWTRLQLLSKWYPEKYGNKAGPVEAGGVEIKIESEFDDA